MNIRIYATARYGTPDDWMRTFTTGEGGNGAHIVTGCAPQNLTFEQFQDFQRRQCIVSIEGTREDFCIFNALVREVPPEQLYMLSVADDELFHIPSVPFSP